VNGLNFFLYYGSFFTVLGGMLLGRGPSYAVSDENQKNNNIDVLS
jgi:hypothetical protein